MSIHDLINLSIDPYEGVGPFKLGMSLYQTIQLIQNSNLKLKITSSLHRALPSSTPAPTILIVEEYGLKLVFNSQYQILIFIEIYKFDKILFSKNDNVLNLDYKLPNFQKIYNKIFGPTYPGFIDGNDNYNLSYNGVSFVFDLKNYTNSSKKLIQFINDNSQSIFCHSILLFRADSISDFKENMAKFMLEPSYTSKLIREVEINLMEKSIEFYHQKNRSADFSITIGQTTMQEIIENLGPPEAVLNSMNDKYHNYFKIGCDFCYDLTMNNGYSSILKKVNIHNNLLNSLEFMKYEKLNWKMHQSPADQMTNFISFNKISKYFNGESKPIFLNRNEYDLINSLNKKYETMNLNNSHQNFELIDYEDDIDDNSDLTYNEEFDSNSNLNLNLNSTSNSPPSSSSTTTTTTSDFKHDLSSETLSQNDYETCISKNRSKDWGLTNLYFYPNVAFEVLIDNDEISMISIF